MATRIYLKALVKYPTTTKVITGFANFALADMAIQAYNCQHYEDIQVLESFKNGLIGALICWPVHGFVLSSIIPRMRSIMKTPVPKFLLEVLMLPSINFCAYMAAYKVMWDPKINPAETFVAENQSVMITYALGRLILLGWTALKCQLIGLNLLSLVYAGQMSIAIKKDTTKTN